MAPRKRSRPESDSADGDLKPVKSPQVATTTATRVTRSSAHRALQGLPVPEPVALPKPNNKKAGGKDAKAEEKPVETVPPLANAERTIVIEHCNQCNAFKTRALQVKNGLETGVCGITVLVNPEKPRRGCFEIREEGGKKFISLLDMKRPFSPMKALDMEVVISDIVGELNV